MKQNYTVDNTIYNDKYILPAVEAFGDVADIEYENGVIFISGDNADDNDIIFAELMNFITGLINE